MKTKLQKGFRRAASLLCAIVMAITCAAMTVPETAYADDTPTGTIIVENNTNTTHVSIAGKTFNAYKIFSLKQNSDHSAYDYELETDYQDCFKTAAKVLDVGEDKTDDTIEYYTGDWDNKNSKADTATLDVTSNDSVRAFMESALYTWTEDATQQTVTKSTEATASFVEAFAKALKANLGSLSAAATATGGAANSSGVQQAEFTKLALGYYLITGEGSSMDGDSDDVVAACMLDTTTWKESTTAGESSSYTVTVQIKAGIPTCDKDITAVDGVNVTGNTNSDTEDAASGEIGDIVKFEVDSCLPNLTGYTAYTYKMTDTFSEGLDLGYKDSTTSEFTKVTGDTDVANAITVQVQKSDGTTWTTINSGVTYTFSNRVLTVTVDYDTLKKYVDDNDYGAGAAVRFVYSAKINSSAVVGQDGNLNTAKITYSNNPSDTSTANDTPDSEVKVYTFALDLYKYAGDIASTPTALAGAKFLLYDASAVDGTTGELKSGATPLTISTETAGATTPDTLYSAQASSEKVTINSTETTVSVLTSATGTGAIVVNGLKEGTYYLKEIEAPAGYNLKEDLIQVTYDPTYDSSSKTELKSLEVKDGEGTILLYNDGSNYTTDTTDTSKTYKLAGLYLEIENNTGSELPSTGGYGLTIIYIIGGLLMALAVISTTVKKLARNTR